MTKTIHGRIHGRHIELDEDAGIADGQEVEIIVKPAKPKRPWGEGLKRSAGVAADHLEFDKLFEQLEYVHKGARNELGERVSNKTKKGILT